MVHHITVLPVTCTGVAMLTIWILHGKGSAMCEEGRRLKNCSNFFRTKQLRSAHRSIGRGTGAHQQRGRVCVGGGILSWHHHRQRKAKPTHRFNIICLVVFNIFDNTKESEGQGTGFFGGWGGGARPTAPMMTIKSPNKEVLTFSYEKTLNV